MKGQCRFRMWGGSIGGDNAMELLSFGEYSDEGEVFSIEFDEADSINPSAKNKIMISDDIVTLNTIKDRVTTLVFQRGRSHSGFISTELEKIPFSIYSHSIDFTKSENDVKLKVLYTVDVNGESLYDEFSITAELSDFN